MAPRFLIDAQQALGFLTHQASYIETQVYETQYPDVQYPQLVPVDEGAPEWVKSITFMSVDRVGAADWFSAQATDVPLADVERSKAETGVEMAAIGYRYNLEEIAQAIQTGVNLDTSRAAAALRAYEEFVERVAFTGDTTKGWTGLINDPSVTRTTAAADGTGASALWTAKTDVQIMRDINDQLTAVYTSSLQAETADTMLLPINRFTYLATRRVEGQALTLLQWLQGNNAFTALTGRPLLVRAVRGLDTAGQGGTARAMFYRRDPNVLRLHLPMRHRFLPVWQRGPLVFDVPGIFRLGGVEIRRPVAVRYLDGI
jgi:hypothetical protein